MNRNDGTLMGNTSEVIKPVKIMKKTNILAGPDALLKTGPPLDDEYLEWMFTHTFVINLKKRPERWLGMLARLGDWSKYVTQWEATDGSSLNVTDYVQRGVLSSKHRMIRGQIGCYDSHYRIWKHIVDNNIQWALILEDDANIRHTKEYHSKINEALEDVEKIDPLWDVCYLGTSSRPPQHRLVGGVGLALGCQGLFAYVVSNRGASKLVQLTGVYKMPVDIVVGDLMDSGALNVYGCIPSLFYVVPVVSDTETIR